MMIVSVRVVPRCWQAAEGTCRLATTNNCQEPSPGSARGARRLHVVVASVALVLAICASTVVPNAAPCMLSFQSSVCGAASAVSEGTTDDRHGSPSPRPATLAVEQDDPELHRGALLATSHRQRMRLIKRVTRLRHKLEETVRAMQGQLDGAADSVAEPSAS